MFVFFFLSLSCAKSEILIDLLLLLPGEANLRINVNIVDKEIEFEALHFFLDQSILNFNLLEKMTRISHKLRWTN